MKIRSLERCGSCRKDTLFEFEDIPDIKQFTICSNCGTKHYRTLTSSEIASLRVYGRRFKRG